MLIQYFSIDQAENTGEHLHLATSSEAYMVSPQQTKSLHLQLRPLPSLPNMLAPPLPAPRHPSTKLPYDSQPPLPPFRKKPLVLMEANMTPSLVIQKRFLEDSPKTFSRKNQAVFVAVLLCLVVITVPTVYRSYFSEGSEVLSNSFFFVHIN